MSYKILGGLTILVPGNSSTMEWENPLRPNNENVEGKFPVPPYTMVNNVYANLSHINFDILFYPLFIHSNGTYTFSIEIQSIITYKKARININIK